MSFYTFCDRVGSKIFHRYVDDNGKRHQQVLSDFPIQLFIKGIGPHRSLYGDQLVEKKYTDVSDALDFVKKYRDITPVYGQTSMAHQFISNQYPGQIEFDFNKYRVLNLDIETRFDGYDGDDEVQVRRVFSNNIETTTVAEMRLLDGGWEVYDIYNARWYSCGVDHPLQRPGGFPDPQKAEYEITSISCKMFRNNKKVTFGVKDYTIKDKDQVYIKCDDEAHLLREFVSYNRAMDPDAWTGWNTESFDIPYIVNRIKKVLGDAMANKLSPFHAQTTKCINEYTDRESGDILYRIMGITSLDYMRLYQQFNPKRQESYALDFIAAAELKEGKLDYSQYENLMHLYKDSFETFIEYNERDVFLVERLDDKKQFIRLAVTMVLMTKSRYQEVSGKVKLWDNLIYNMLKDEGIVIPPEKISKGKGIVGAYVKEPVPAKYRWVASLDLTSLYPSICMMYNMSPETMVVPEQGVYDYLERLLAGEDLARDARRNGRCMTANGAEFSLTKQGVLPRAMKYVFDARKRYKNLMLEAKNQKEDFLRQGGSKDSDEYQTFDNKIAMLDATQGAMKVLANSGYGVTAQNSFRYYSRDIAQGITLTGQLVIQYIATETNKFLNQHFSTNRDYVITCDTDSMYLELDRVPTDPRNTQQSVDEIDRFIESILQPFLDASFEHLSDKMGAPKNLMDMKREAISDIGIWRGKKNYVLQVYDMEGVRYATPELKMMGIETARSDKPMIVRKELEVCLKIMLQGTEDDLIKELESFHDRWMQVDMNAISRPMGISSMDGVTVETAKAFHVKAALVHNRLLLDLNLARKYNRIRSGNKVRLLPLKIPNPARNNYIAYVGELPAEFGLHDYIDREGHYQSVFLNPIKSFADIIGWKVERVSSLEDLFG